MKNDTIFTEYRRRPENGKKTTFLFHNGEILAECDGESAPVRRYVRGLGLSHVQTLSDGTYHSCHLDEQGSTAYITGQDKTVENCYQYDAFGNLIEHRGTIANRILYTGQQYDQETEQYYLRVRYYNPAVGRFLQEDTYRGDGLNLYAYCGNNPVMYYDPSGHKQDEYKVEETTKPEQQRTAGEDSSGSKGDSKTGNSLKKVKNNKEANKVAKEFGYEGTEDLKQDFVFKDGAKSNMMNDTETGEVVLVSVKDSSIQVHTGLFR